MTPVATRRAPQPALPSSSHTEPSWILQYRLADDFWAYVEGSSMQGTRLMTGGRAT